MPDTTLPTATVAEIDRYVLLFDGLFAMTGDWVARAPDDRLDWTPSDDPIHRFGDGKTPMTLRNLYIHVAVAEHVWIRAVAALPDGATVPPPVDAALGARLRGGDLNAEAARVHAANMAVARGLGPADLGKTLIFSGRRWTGMEFLWAVYAHCAFHLGHIDLYLRLNGRTTPEFFVFHPTPA